MDINITPASNYPTPDLVQLLNLSFESYLIPVHFDSSQFLNMLRKDTIDLIARRNTLSASRLAAMGISKEFRGKKAGTWLVEKLVDEARERKDHDMVLEVIEQNEPAVRLYQNCGFETVRRLIGLIHQDAKQDAKGDLQEVDLREIGQLISQQGLPDLPWQLSGETIALMNPPTRAYKHGETYIVISNSDVEHVVIWSLLVETSARGQGLGVDMLKRVMAQHAGKIWHVPAIWPEEFSVIFERAGFEREKLSQWQMKLYL